MNERSRAEEIFFSALEKTGSDERSIYLGEACAGDDGLRRRIESLLAAHFRAGQFLERPVAELDTVGQAANAVVDLSFLGPSCEPGSLGRLDYYEILEVVGRGGMGVVLRARDTKLMRVVAIKVLSSSLVTRPAAHERFVSEARAAAAVRDDHVVAIHAVHDNAAVPFFVMEFIDGCNLDALIRRGEPSKIQEILRIGIQVARGLAAAHKQALVHRDIKPANILLENGVQRVKLTDFGLARAVNDTSHANEGLIAGTPLYMAPEQATGHSIDLRADLFSLGSVLYELCTGQAAFRAPTTVGVMRRICDQTPPPIQQFNPAIPEDLCRLIDQLHAKKPDDRPASAHEVAERLETMLADLTALRPTKASGQAEPKRTAYVQWPWAAALILFFGLGISEATDLTQLSSTVIRLFSSEGTLVVEVDDPEVKVAVEGADVIITGAGAREIRLQPGDYKIEASKDGKLVRRELVTVVRNGRQVVRISKEADSSTAPNEAGEWEKSVAFLSPEKQVEAVTQRLKELNPRFHASVASEIRDGAVVGLKFSTDSVSDITPVRALTRLEWLDCRGTPPDYGHVADLAPLRGLPLRVLVISDNLVTDLSPLAGMPLERLDMARNARVKDLSPLTGMPLTLLDFTHSQVAELSPLRGMKLKTLYCDQTQVSDLSALQGMPLTTLTVGFTKVSDISPLAGLPLARFHVHATAVADLSPLRGMPLTDLSLHRTPVSDLSPIADCRLTVLWLNSTEVPDLRLIKGMPLQILYCDFERERDGEIVRSLTALELINDLPVAEFWKTVGAQ